MKIEFGGKNTKVDVSKRLIGQIYLLFYNRNEESL